MTHTSSRRARSCSESRVMVARAGGRESLPRTHAGVVQRRAAAGGRCPADTPLTPDEADYVAKARSANTLRGYRSDWAEFTAWCTSHGYDPIPAPPAAVSQYLTELARHGAKVGTMSRRISAIRFARTLRQLPHPCDHARVQAVWEGIRRTHTTPAD